jgi:hypothetical protein
VWTLSPRGPDWMPITPKTGSLIPCRNTVWRSLSPQRYRVAPAARLQSQLGTDIEVCDTVRLVIWPVLIFVVVIVVLLAIDDALLGLLESALALYGPLVVVLGVYVLFKLALHGIRFIGSQFM